jgi:hypothetical protein
MSSQSCVITLEQYPLEKDCYLPCPRKLGPSVHRYPAATIPSKCKTAIPNSKIEFPESLAIKELNNS